MATGHSKAGVGGHEVTLTSRLQVSTQTQAPIQARPRRKGTDSSPGRRVSLPPLQRHTPHNPTTDLLSLAAARKPPLPPVGGDSSASVRVDAKVQSLLTPPEIAALLRAQGDQLGFLYLDYPEEPRTSTAHHAYNLEIVSHARINPNNYYTVSSSGVTHITSTSSEFTPLDRWLYEYEAFTCLRRKLFFKQFRLWKAFALWRKCLFGRKRQDAQRALQNNLFLADPIFGPATIAVRNRCLDVVQMRLCSITPHTTYTLGTFMASQQAQTSTVAGQLEHFRQSVLALVQDTCQQAAAQTNIVIELADGANVEPPSYTEQSRRRAFCARVTHFIRYTDLLVAGSMQSLVVESVAHLWNALSQLEEAALLKSDTLAAPGASAEFEQACSTPGTSTQLPAHQTPAHVTAHQQHLRVVVPKSVGGKKTASRVGLAGLSAPEEAGPLPPLFRVELELAGSSLQTSPSQLELSGALASLTELFEQSVVGVKLLLTDRSLHGFTQPCFNGRRCTVALGEGVNLQQVLRDDLALASLRQGLQGLAQRAYAFAESYAATVDCLRVMLIESTIEAANWAPGQQHTPEVYRAAVQNYLGMHARATSLPVLVNMGVLQINCQDFRQRILPAPTECIARIKTLLPTQAAAQGRACLAHMDDMVTRIETEPTCTADYVDLLTFLNTIEQQTTETEHEVKCVSDLYDVMSHFEFEARPEALAEFQTLRSFVIRVRDVVKKALAEKPKLVERLTDRLDKDISELGTSVLRLGQEAQAPLIFDPQSEVDQALTYTRQLHASMNALQERAAQYKGYQKTFDIEVTKFSALEVTHLDIRNKKLMWETVRDWEQLQTTWLQMPFGVLEPDDMNTQITRIFKQTYTLQKGLSDNQVLPSLMAKINVMKDRMPVIADLRNPALMPRHWQQINAIVGQELTGESTLTLGLLSDLGIWRHKEALQEVSGAASSESSLDTMLRRIEDAWKAMEFPVLAYRDARDIFILGGMDDVQVLLDDSQVNIATISTSRYVAPIKSRVDDMQRQLNLFSDTLDGWIACQRNWLYLESIFSAPDIQRQLPGEAKMFLEVDRSFKEAMRRTAAFPNALRAGCTPGLLELFQRNNTLLDQIQKCLEDYLESKRMVFSRFYFLSNDELLEILSQTRNPQAVQPHMRKCFDAIQKLTFGQVTQEDGEIKYTNDILAMVSPEGESVALTKGLKARGNVEVWLGSVEEAMVKSLRALTKTAHSDYHTRPRPEWASRHASQVVLSVSQMEWCKSVVQALTADQPLAALREFETKCQRQLAELASITRSKISKLFRAVVGALITIDVHARDIVTGMVTADCTSPDEFEWTKQLRYAWQADIDDMVVQMSNSRYIYAHEYLGASMRLVITPLTDRCYLCLMGALQLNLGGAPAGPAGTGKTETTKDLAKALGTQCVVFNCSEGLDYRMMGRFFSGLAQSGAWCCFDEFNRIDIEVLSVIAQQILTINNAKGANASRFMFEGREIRLISTCAVFITMNPGYAGRTELPDNLKALFRPMAMMVPDYGLIAEVILFSEGFEDPKNLARKMTQMYKLCSEQLSQQDHYDFGMRAVKSVLVMAGALKRERVGQSEATVLLTALRDSNLPKFLTADAVLFQAILSDLFPGVELPAHDYGLLQTAIEASFVARGLLPHEAMVAKVIQFYETMVVRHGVMLVGPTGGGKTTVYQVLQVALTQLYADRIEHADYQPVETHVLNPKAVSMGELYGEVNPITTEWKDGLMANLVRHCVSQTTTHHQWIVCDGPVDALWIENMNTVLDDNKMLCLANSERIKLTPYMHMVFEVQDLAVASPATVSRCGMVYVDPSETGWRPYVRRWLATFHGLVLQLSAFVWQLFEDHWEDGLRYVRKHLTQAIDQVDLGKTAALCNLFRQLVDTKVQLCTPETYSDVGDTLMSTLAHIFLFAYVWALGGNLIEASHEAFDKHVRDRFNEFRPLKIPRLGSVYDYVVNFDVSPVVLQPWEELVPKFTYSPDVSFFDMLVPTVSTVKYTYLFESYTMGGNSILFTGGTGVGKSVIAKDALSQLADKGLVVPVVMNFSAQTSSVRTQEIIESKLEKKRKNVMGAPLNKKVVLLVDDINMPRLDSYGSQPPIELLRQYQDFRGFYDRQNLFWKEIRDVVLAAACAPPGGGRNALTPRFVRHFTMLALPAPDGRSLKSIFEQILHGFFSVKGFSRPIQNAVGSVVASAVEIYERMSTDLLPTPAKSHYIFNLRDLSKCIQGILQVEPAALREADSLYDLYNHEAMRVFHDRLINRGDKDYFQGMLAALASKHFGKTVDVVALQTQPVLFGDFLKPGTASEERRYERMEMRQLGPLLEEYLDQYNLSNSKEMNLVFFADALEHVTRISRMIRQPRGNALLVGVGGTGKQSLTRMACHMAGYQCFQIEITRGYGYTEFREDLKRLYEITGSKGQDTVFLFTDTQIVVEEFLEDINNILNSGEVPNLFEPDELEKYLQPVRSLAKQAGVGETRDAVFQFFIGRVRQKLHLVLCMSPVGDSFRARCRMFPSLVNCCTIDWFTEWPREALLGVARRFFGYVDFGSESLKESISEMCVEIHTSVSNMADRFFSELRRKCYTTPTSYLELINLYTSMLETKRRELVSQRDRFQTGLNKLLETNDLVVTMEQELTALKPVLQQKSEDTTKLMEKIKVDQAAADNVRAIVQQEEKIVKNEAAETEAIKADAQRDLDAALPALAAANQALDSLEKKDVQEVKVFASPPELVQVVMEAVCVLFGRKPDWKAAKQLLGESDFLAKMVSFDKDNVGDAVLRKLKPYIDNPKFQPEVVEKVSKACTSMCLWVRAVDLYAHVYRTVEPKRAKLSTAEETLKTTMAALKEKQDQLNEVERQVKQLKAHFRENVDAKEKLERSMAMTSARLGRAAKLQAALGDEQVRWAEAVRRFDSEIHDVVGNVFVAAACVAYFGAFTSAYRQELVSMWVAKCQELGLPVSLDLNVAAVLSTPYQIRQWNACGLPRDILSTENAVLVTCGRRWPLMIDPQDQANNWIRQMEGPNGLKIIKLSEPTFLRTLENAIRIGTPVLLEDVGETLDPALEPVLLKQTFKQGGRLLIRLGDTDVDYDRNFRFYMTTKMANPHYLPEICIKVTVINFTVTKTGLEDQLLSDVVRLERPDLEEQRTKLILQINEDKAQLKSIEDKILKLLFQSEGNILDDEVLINTLNDSKTTSSVINERLALAEKTELSITEAREKYRPAATRGSVVFFVIADMGLVDPMYQYSLEFFKKIFVLCIETADQSADLDVRLQNIIDFSTANIFANVSRGLFERHKLVFSFMLCAEILRNSGYIQDTDWSFFLRGAGAGEKKRPPKPAAAWLSDELWNRFVDAEAQLQVLEGFTADVVAARVVLHLGKLTFVVNNGLEDSNDALRVNWDARLTSFQKLLVVQLTAPEQMAGAVAHFVAHHLSKQFVESPPVELASLYKDLAATIPLVFILSVGSDPMTAFQRFARSRGYGHRVHAISLGQGQGPVAENLIAQARKNGDWVFLQNCHLAQSWMPSMEVVIKSLGEAAQYCHEDFRLYLSSAPCSFFPVSVLQNSVKITNEPPKGLRANLRGAFAGINNAEFEQHPLGPAYRRLVFGLCFFHAVIQERKKFGPLGFNIQYDFSNTDRECALQNLKIFLGESLSTAASDGNAGFTDAVEAAQLVPFDALEFITGLVTYGGRVTDSWDQRCLSTILRTFFSPQTLKAGYTYSVSGTYYAPSADSLNDYVSFIENLPFSDGPEIFGMHENAQTTYLISEQRTLLETVLAVQPRLTTGNAGKSPDAIVYELAELIQNKLPKAALDLDSAQEGLFDKDGQGRVSSLSTVLRQEIERYNKLLEVLWSSLDNVKKAIKGFVVMSLELERVYVAFINNTVPSEWSAAAYPSLKPLGAWVADLQLRLEFVSSWLLNGPPRSFWLPGFFFQQAFLTGTLQTHARKYQAPIDTLSFQFVVLDANTNITQDAGTTLADMPAFEDGVVVHGLFMDSMRWSVEEQCVADTELGLMFSRLPAVRLLPVANYVPGDNIYVAPLYKTSVRAGMLSTTGHSTNFVVAVHLPSRHPADYWIARGAALLCQIDD